jgi:diguanylate cyclase (GGDEF)-like protein
MHLQMDAFGVVVHVVPTLAKLHSDSRLNCRPFLTVFDLLGAAADMSVEQLFAGAGAKLRLRFREGSGLTLKGVLVPTASGAFLNLSFGISILAAVREFGLTSTDFTATDLAMEILYLIEAKTIAMEASRKLNARMQQATLAAQEASTDALTSLKNRRAMDQIIAGFLSSGQAFALMQLDLFKSVNDTFGHAAGDHVLQQAAQIMLAHTRAHDAVLRIGGDDFILIFSDVIDMATLDMMTVRLIRELEKPIISGGHSCQILGSVGITLASDYTAPAARKLLADADAALYAAKRAGGAQHKGFSQRRAKLT